MRTKRLAVTFGIVWAATVFLTTLLSVYTGYGKLFLDFVASIYPGYSISLLGSVIGLVYAFFDMFVGVYIVSWVYHQVSANLK